MERTTLFAEVLLPLPVPGTFTYRIPFSMNSLVQVGQRVSVQFGSRRVYAGLILKLHEQAPATGTPKYILSVLDEKPLVFPLQIKFWSWISDYYMSTLGEVMNVAIPSAFKLSSESKILLSETFRPDQDPLSDSEYQITEALMQQRKLTIKEVGQIVGFQKVLPLLKSMIQRQMIFMEEELNSSYKPKLEKYLLFSDLYLKESALHELLDGLGRRAPKQMEILMAMMTLAGLPLKKGILVKRSDLQQKTGGSLSALKALLDKGILEEVEKPASRFDGEDTVPGGPIVFSEEQQRAFEAVNQEMQEHRVVLLHGVTSSGKTEIYIKLIEETLEKGRQVLYLLPEIALTTQIITRLRKHFGDEIGVYHSRYNQNERAEVWENVAGLQDAEVHKRYRVILGPRSAMFLPFENLGLIIVDEEHDPSYKQFDPAPRYNARDASIFLAGLHDARVVLGSATPAVETYYNAQSGKYGLVALTERYGGVEMPRILVVNLKEEKRRRMLRSHFSSVLLKHTEAALEQKQQVILFQNRRGFSLRIECEECNWVPQCRNCDVTMTYHKKQELLRCHYCGYSRTVPPVCEHCGSPHLTMEGFGTEKVEEELSIILPSARIDRMDLDTTRSKSAFQRIFSDFENGKTDILTGTQMVTKGLDFDNVQVVGILSADNMLQFPDFRAHERSFQLMEQVSGRAGRKNKQGTVIIQSWDPTHPVIGDVVRHNYAGMFGRELGERRKFHYPPFYRLIILKLKHKDPALLNKAADVLANDLRSHFGNLVYGPEYPMVSRIKNKYIKQILLKIPRSARQHEQKQVLRQVLMDFNRHTHLKSVQIQVDVDPQ